jgi:hypothetical protein
MDALRAVRGELGPDALVPSTGPVPVRGWLGAREVDVTAASEGPAVSVQRHAAPVVRSAPDPASSRVTPFLLAARVMGDDVPHGAYA